MVNSVKTTVKPEKVTVGFRVSVGLLVGVVLEAAGYTLIIQYANSAGAAGLAILVPALVASFINTYILPVVAVLSIGLAIFYFARHRSTTALIYC